MNNVLSVEVSQGFDELLQLRSIKVSAMADTVKPHSTFDSSQDSK